MSRVQHPDDARASAVDGVERRVLVPPERGSELALDQLRLEPGAPLELHDELHDTLLFVHDGGGRVAGEQVEGRMGVLLPAGGKSRLEAGTQGLSCVRATLGADTDLHAPMGDTERLVALAHVEPGQATGARSFQLLYGPHNGSTRGTLFVGYIPSGRAPWHYHLYDEIVWILDGEGRLRLGDEIEALEPGAAFRLRPREVHIVETTAIGRELVVLGLFTPAGSPSAAYLPADVAETSAISG
ncbi:MAG: cupin domain-containing protein [Actinobacteria bacterium]|nr:cupin domain-containing protein [Actinomycetota bacterium]